MLVTKRLVKLAFRGFTFGFELLRLFGDRVGIREVSHRFLVLDRRVVFEHSSRRHVRKVRRVKPDKAAQDGDREAGCDHHRDPGVIKARRLRFLKKFQYFCFYIHGKEEGFHEGISEG